MVDMESCREAKKSGTTGMVLAVIGSVMLGILAILVVLVFSLPLYSLLILVFLYYGGWILAIIGIILTAIGHYMMQKKEKECSIA